MGVADALHRGTEGWIAGIRLAVLSARTTEGLAGLVAEAGPSSYVMGYFFDEVLSTLPPELTSALLSVSTLDRFCPQLLDAIWRVEGNGSSLEELCLDPTLTGRDFLDWAEGEHLFLIPLEEEGRWFRLHRLFRSLLAEELNRRCGDESREILRRRAEAWIRDHGLMDEGSPSCHTRSTLSASDRVGLTPRETEILGLVAQGKSNKRVARDLSVSVETVKKHVYNSFRKLDVENRLKAVEKARALGILKTWPFPSHPSRSAIRGSPVLPLR
jgi:ATP/maltotriose-dependent transcriptional regulator MalT